MVGKPGMRHHTATEETKAKVGSLVVAGLNQPDIARVLGISEDTLQKHYREVLDTAAHEVLAKVASTLVQKALGGCVASAIFFLKTRGKKQGWSERLELTGDEGGAIKLDDASADETKRKLASLIASECGVEVARELNAG